MTWITLSIFWHYNRKYIKYRYYDTKLWLLLIFKQDWKKKKLKIYNNCKKNVKNACLLKIYQNYGTFCESLEL